MGRDRFVLTTPLIGPPGGDDFPTVCAMASIRVLGARYPGVRGPQSHPVLIGEAISSRASPAHAFGFRRPDPVPGLFSGASSGLSGSLSSESRSSSPFYDDCEEHDYTEVGWQRFCFLSATRRRPGPNQSQQPPLESFDWPAIADPHR